jgi:hypothetical protein
MSMELFRRNLFEYIRNLLVVCHTLAAVGKFYEGICGVSQTTAQEVQRFTATNLRKFLNY